MADFTNGIENAQHYLNAVDQASIEVPTSVTSNLLSGTVSSSTTSFSIREIICSLLAGNGIKLPNLQICLKVNIGRLLSISGLPLSIKNALLSVEKALDDFITHTGIDNVLGRLNSAIGEFAAIANMINFCGTPVVPRAIPNVLKDVFGAYLGKGQDLMDRLGVMLDNDIGLCLGDGGFNVSIFQSGLLKDIGDWVDDFGNMPTATINSITNSLKNLSSDINDLIKFENNFSGTDNAGGSTFSPKEGRVHTGIGTALPENMTLAESQKYASLLKALYSATSAYPVDDAGNNIMHYLLEPELISKLELDSNPTYTLEENEPVYDHCGVITGYTKSTIQAPAPTSTGGPTASATQPGVVGLAESGIVLNNSPASTVNLGTTNPNVQSSVPDTPIGKNGDKKGDMAVNSTHTFIAIANYDGTTAIWSKSANNTSW